MANTTEAPMGYVPVKLYRLSKAGPPHNSLGLPWHLMLQCSAFGFGRKLSCWIPSSFPKNIEPCSSCGPHLTFIRGYHRNPILRNRRTTFPPKLYAGKRESLSLAYGDTGFHCGAPSLDPDLKSTGADRITETWSVLPSG